MGDDVGVREGAAEVGRRTLGLGKEPSVWGEEGTVVGEGGRLSRGMRTPRCLRRCSLRVLARLAQVLTQAAKKVLAQTAQKVR